eukprot:15973321-Heterocapsa_arctica.AAC.1
MLVEYTTVPPQVVNSRAFLSKVDSHHCNWFCLLCARFGVQTSICQNGVKRPGPHWLFLSQLL